MTKDELISRIKQHIETLQADYDYYDRQRCMALNPDDKAYYQHERDVRDAKRSMSAYYLYLAQQIDDPPPLPRVENIVIFTEDGTIRDVVVEEDSPTKLQWMVINHDKDAADPFWVGVFQWARSLSQSPFGLGDTLLEMVERYEQANETKRQRRKDKE